MNNWQLQRVDNIQWTKDTSGIYCLINWDVKTDTVRLDIMSDNHEPMQSFAGSSDNVRKHVVRYLMTLDYVAGFVSLEHAAYIGSELEKADTLRIDYVQDGSKRMAGSIGTLADIMEHIRSEAATSDKVCPECGYYKWGFSSDNILMCLNCGEAWTSDNAELTDDQLLDKVTSDNKEKADTIKKYYDVQDIINAECSVEPVKCRHCGIVGETTFNQGMNDAFCASCGKWQLAG